MRFNSILSGLYVNMLLSQMYHWSLNLFKGVILVPELLISSSMTMNLLRPCLFELLWLGFSEARS